MHQVVRHLAALRRSSEGLSVQHIGPHRLACAAVGFGVPGHRPHLESGLLQRGAQPPADEPGRARNQYLHGLTLADWGLARFLNLTGPTQTGFVCGAPGRAPIFLHLSLEQVPSPVYKLLAHATIVLAERTPVAVVKFLHDLKVHRPPKMLRPNRSAESRSACSWCPALRSPSTASPNMRSARPTSW